ncbi:winged helix-turn-helix domain-containing protein [Chloroflexi bacterium TSY]|nr:winged helix-turn-helix domain-containing protein [Chloroflexi bacterium TSY]
MNHPKIRRLYSMLPSKQQDLITVGNNIIIDRDSHTVIVDGKAVEGLTRLEFSVLAYLASPPNTVRSRYNMLEDVWKSIDFGFGVVDKCIFGIRSKISPDNRERFIGTVHKVGYKLKVDG